MKSLLLLLHHCGNDNYVVSSNPIEKNEQAGRPTKVSLVSSRDFYEQSK